MTLRLSVMYVSVLLLHFQQWTKPAPQSKNAVCESLVILGFCLKRSYKLCSIRWEKKIQKYIQKIDFQEKNSLTK